MKRFLRDLFRMLSANGERRLVKNYFNGKMIWTKGVEPKFTENAELKKKLTQGSKGKLADSIVSEAFEPIKNRRFVIDFPGIDSSVFKSYRFLGEDLMGSKK